MSDDFELVRGSGNVFRDFGDVDADTKQMKAHLAAEIIGILDRRKLTVRAAGELIGEDYSDISKIRNAQLSKFTLDRLVRIANKLGRHVEMTVTRMKPDTSSHVGAHA
jgi:predicted XRE-type DNA-binding protein